jgi:hypothetical protein
MGSGRHGILLDSPWSKASTLFILKIIIMNKLLSIIALAGCLSLSACTIDGWVEAQPGDVAYERPVSPGVDYVWIDGDWEWSGGAYVWHQGHWDRRREGHVWVGGTWEHGGRGYRWHRGHWQ